ncbi:MAG: YfhO family protein, partial [Gemmatimonadota bacterium]|nr:YfhO family protein [Gemmatimonadota bacterium]
GRDVTPYFYPMKRYLADAVWSGRFPLWNPYVAGGEPFFAALQPGVLYPGSVVLYLLPFPKSVDWLVVGHFLFAAAGWVLLLRREDRSPAAAACGAAAFVLGGYVVSLGNFINNLQTVAWAPWLFLAWGYYLSDGRRWRLVAFAAVCTLAFLGGEPQLLAILLLVVLARSLLGLAPGDPGVRRQVSGFATAGVLALLLAGLQLAPFIEFIGQSVRTLPIELSFAASRSQELAGLLHLLLPPALEAGEHGFTTAHLASSDVPWLLSIYPGAVVAVLSVVGLGTMRRLERRFWITLAILGVILALGSVTPVYTILFESLPPLRAFRYPEKFALLLALPLPWAAAAGVEAWRDRSRTPGRFASAFLVLAGGYGGLALLLAVGVDLPGTLCGTNPGLALCGDPAAAARLYAGIALRLGILLLVAGAISALAVRGALGAPLATWALVTVAVVDLVAAHRVVNPSVDSEVYLRMPWAAEVLEAELDRRELYRYRGTPIRATMGETVRVRGAAELSNIYLDRTAMGPNAGQSFGILQQDGLQGVELQSVAMTHDAAINGWAADPVHFLRMMNVRYYADATPEADSLAGLLELARHPELPIRLFEVPDALPRAFVAAGHEIAAGPGDALRRALERPESPRRVVLEAKSAGRARSVPGETAGRGPGAILAATWEAERVRLIVRSSRRSTLVLMDRWYPGWKVTVDGEPAELLRANGVFRAVSIPAGQSDVEFRYAPMSLAIGGLSSALGLAGCVGLFWWSRRREDPA